MINIKKLKTILCLSVIIPSTGWAGGLELVYESKIQVEETDQKTKEIKITETDQTSQIVLLPHKFSVRIGDVEQIYNYPSARVLTLDHKQKTFYDHSLYALASYRAAEMENRLGSSKMMQATNINYDKSSRIEFELETLFNLSNTKNPTLKDIKEEVKNTQHEFFYHGEKVAFFTLKKEKIPTPLKESFKKYMIFNYNIHPIIRNNLLGYNQLPEYIQYRYKPFTNQVVTVTTKLKSMSINNQDNIEIPSAYEQIYSGPNILRAYKIKKMLSEQDYILMAEKLVENKQHFDAFLALNEYVFQYGEKPFPKIEKIIADIGNDHSLVILDDALDLAKNKEKAKEVIDIIKSLQKPELKHGYVLNIYLGNLYGMLGDYANAKSMFIKALEHNPFMIKAYINLGDVFMQNYEMQQAWNYIDVAEAIMPHHPALGAINLYKLKLKQNYPEYFAQTQRTLHD